METCLHAKGMVSTQDIKERTQRRGQRRSSTADAAQSGCSTKRMRHKGQDRSISKVGDQGALVW